MQPSLLDPRRTGLHLRRLMDQRGISITDLQELLGLSCPQTVYRWLSGISMPTLDHLYSLSRYFGITIDELLIGDDTSDADR